MVLNLVDLGVDLDLDLDLCLPWTSALEAGNNLKRRGVRWIPTLLGPFLEVSLRNLAATGGRPLYILHSPAFTAAFTGAFNSALKVIVA